MASRVIIEELHTLIPWLVLALVSSTASVSFARSIPVTRWPAEMGWREISPRTWRAEHPWTGPLRVAVLREQAAARDVDLGRVAVIAESGLASSLATVLDGYLADLVTDGYSVILESSSGGSDLELREHLADLHAEGLVGAVLIGDLPIAWYEVENDHGEDGYAVFPCDLFYMDLDGSFADVDGNGVWDGHLGIAGGDTRPEIWIGQLRVTPAMGDAVELLTGYFDRNHRFRAGQLNGNGSALVYVDDDWAEWVDYYVDELSGAFDDVTSVAIADITRADDYIPRLLHTFDAIALYAHSSPDSHFFVLDGVYDLMTYTDVPVAADALFYNLFACSNANYADYVYMAGVYVLGTDHGLLAVGSTKTGSMLAAASYYGRLQQYEAFGEAFLGWWADSWPYPADELYWHYGMTMIGDPTLRRGYPTLGIHPSDVVVDVRDGEPREVELEFVNLGHGDLAWNAVADQPWMTLTRTSGTVEAGEDRLTLQLEPDGLDQGYHLGTVRIDAPGATNTPVSVGVDLGILPPAVVQVMPNPVLVPLRDGTGVATVRIGNQRPGRMTWTAEVDQTWVTLAASGGETNDDAFSLDIEVDVAGPGPHTARLLVSSPDSDEGPVEVSIVADEAPGGCGTCATGSGTGSALLVVGMALVFSRRFVKNR